MFQKKHDISTIKRALQIYYKTKSFRKTAMLCKVGKSSVHRWWTTFHTLLFRQPLQKRKYKPRKEKYNQFPLLLQNIFETTTLKYKTLKSVQKAIVSSNQYVKIPSLSWIHRNLKKAKISRRRFNTVSIFNQRNHEEKLNAFFRQIQCYNNNEIVCVDETAFMNHNNTCYGYFTKGKRPIYTSQPRRCKVNLIMAVHPVNGIVASKDYKHSINTETFIDFLMNYLLPNLPKDTKIILMDNVSFHHSKEVITYLKNNNLQPLFIPPYTPRCNPIEEVFSILKRCFRSCNDNLTFEQKIEFSLEKVKLYKDIVKHYNHTRRYVEDNVNN
jgi:transposase